MATYDELIQLIKSRIRPNGEEEITGAVLQNVLLEMTATQMKTEYLLDVTSEFDYTGSFPGALAAAVEEVRTSAVFISFLNEGHRELWQFNGGEFSDASCWQQFTGGIVGMTEEELEALIEEILTN